MLLWPGLQLLGCGGLVKNQVLYRIQKIEGEELWLEGLQKPLSFAQAKSSLRLSFAQTYASVQGTEYSEPLRLHDCGHKFFTRKHLFVGLSRSRSGALVSLVDKSSQNRKLKSLWTLPPPKLLSSSSAWAATPTRPASRSRTASSRSMASRSI